MEFAAREPSPPSVAMNVTAPPGEVTVVPITPHYVVPDLSAEMKRLERLTAEARRYREELEQRVRESQERVHTAQTAEQAYQQARQQFEQARAESSTWVSQSQSEITTAREQLKQARLEAEALRQQAAQALRDFEQAEYQLVSALKNTQEVTRECRDSATQLKSIHAEIGAARRELTETQSHLQRAQTDQSRLRDALEAAAQTWRQTWQEIWQTAPRLMEITSTPPTLGRSGGMEESAAALVADETPTTPLLLPKPTAETAPDRLVRLLNDALSVERVLADMLQEMIEEVTNDSLRTLLHEQRQSVAQQMARLESHVQALGTMPVGRKGFFQQVLARIWDTLRRPHDDTDRTLQDLLKCVGAVHFKGAMYLALEAMAKQTGDVASAELARRHLAQEQETGERLQTFIQPLAAQAAVTASAP